MMDNKDDPRTPSKGAEDFRNGESNDDKDLWDAAEFGAREKPDRSEDDR